MVKIQKFHTIILILLIACVIINCKSNKKGKKKQKKDNKQKKVKIEDNTDIIKSALDWAKRNNIYINNKIVLNRKNYRDKYYYFSADSRILNNTLLFKIPYEMMITQFTLNEIYNKTKHNKFHNLWEKIIEIKNDHIKYFTTKQLLYMSIILENAMRKKKGPIYKKFKEYLLMLEQINVDIFPVFYDEEEKLYLSGSSFGSQLKRAYDSLNEEYYLLDNELNISIPFQDDFLKARVISLLSSTDFNNTNMHFSNEYNDTVLIPFLDCFNKEIINEKSNARIEIKQVKNTATNLIDYYLEVYSNNEILIGGEINIKWKPFPNSELLLYYGIVEEGNPYNSRYYIDIMNKKIREDLNITNDKNLENLIKYSYELNTEFYDPSVINAYRNISQRIDKYKNKEEGAYELMLDNLKYYVELYDKPLSDGNINIYINGNEKQKDIKEIMHNEKKLLESKIKRLENVITGIKHRSGNNEKNNDL